MNLNVETFTQGVPKMESEQSDSSLGVYKIFPKYNLPVRNIVLKKMRKTKYSVSHTNKASVNLCRNRRQIKTTRTKQIY